MTNPVLVVHRGETEVGYWMWCPGCDDVVRITDGWQWDGNVERPTFTPSILTRGVQWIQDAGFYKANHANVAAGGQVVCHSFLTAGIWNFLPDSTHSLAGQSVPMVPVPDWLLEP